MLDGLMGGCICGAELAEERREAEVERVYDDVIESRFNRLMVLI